MKIQFICSTCRSPTPKKEIEEWVIAKEAICKKMHTIPLKFSESLKNEEIWDECPACHAFYVYVQKDIPKRFFLGLLIGGLLISFYLLSVRFLYGVASLSALTLIDAILYFILPSRLVCYRCESFATEFPNDPRYHPFDHHVAERYRSRSSTKQT